MSVGGQGRDQAPTGSDRVGKVELAEQDLQRAQDELGKQKDYLKQAETLSAEAEEELKLATDAWEAWQGAQGEEE